MYVVLLLLRGHTTPVYWWTTKLGIYVVAISWSLEGSCLYQISDVTPYCELSAEGRMNVYMYILY